MSDAPAFGQWLKQRRKSLDITQEQLADLLGCSPAAIYKIEAGSRRPSRQVAELLSEKLQVPAEAREEFVRFARLPSYSGRFAFSEGANAAAAEEAMFPEQPGGAGTLPVWLNEFIGRDADVERLSRMLLEPGTRLVTLVGPPGIGKTRLGVAVARAMLDSFSDGVYFVALAPVSDPALVMPTIARILGVQESNEQPLAGAVARFLHSRQVLVVLDNFEQVVEAAPGVAYLLGAAARLRVLTSSRQALGVQGERQYSMAPLALPDRGDAVERLPDYPATALFAERARAVQPHFAPTAENADSVVQICRRLDGLPLAIELAAARMKVLSPQEALARLDHGLDLLGGGARDLPPRHRTLRAAIAWSYGLLAEEEQMLFRRLGCFVGGCSFYAVEAICDAGGDLPGGLLDGLASLCDKSLLQRTEAGGESRFWMLETIREYAVERLAESPEAEELARRHAAYYLSLAETTDPVTAGPGQKTLLDRLEREHDNLRAALRWYLAGAESDEARATGALRLVSALRWLWQRRNYLSEGREWQKQALEHTVRLASPAGQRARAWATQHSGEQAYVQGDHPSARALFAQALSAFGQLGDTRGEGFALTYLGVLAGYYGKERERGRDLLAEGVARLRKAGEKWGLARALCFSAYIPFAQGDYEAARDFLDESLAVFREVGDEWSLAWATLVLGETERSQGNYRRAGALYEQSQEIHKRLGDRARLAIVWGNMGAVATYEGQPDRARSYFADSIRLFLELGNDRFATDILAGFAALALSEGDAERAARLLAVTDTLHRLFDYNFEPSEQLEYDRTLAATRAALSEAAFDTAWQEGSRMSLEQATHYALAGDAEERRGE